MKIDKYKSIKCKLQELVGYSTNEADTAFTLYEILRNPVETIDFVIGKLNGAIKDLEELEPETLTEKLVAERMIDYYNDKLTQVENFAKNKEVSNEKSL